MYPVSNAFLKDKESIGSGCVFPDTDEKKEQALRMLYKWRKDDLGTSGTVYAEDFARKHNIRFGIIEPM